MDSRRTNNSRNKYADLDTDQQLYNTTFVQAEPADFRAVVQKLTGSSTDPRVQNNPITLSPRTSSSKFQTVEAPPIPSLLFQERTKPLYRNLAIEVMKQNASAHGPLAFSPGKRVINDSPISTLDLLSGYGSPKTPMSSVHEERQGFDLHPSPLGASSKAEPKLLNLFPTSSDS